jgi:hypothetical protein
MLRREREGRAEKGEVKKRKGRGMGMLRREREGREE